MLETIREFALERLESLGEAETVRKRHAAYFATLVEELFRQLCSHDEDRALTCLEAEQHNLWAVLQRALASGDLALGAAILFRCRFWLNYRHGREGWHWAERLLALPATAQTDRARARLLLVAAVLAARAQDYPAARARLEEAVSLWRSIGGDADLAFALGWLGQVLAQTEPEQAARALALCAEGVAVARPAGDAYRLGLTLTLAGNAALEIGDTALAHAWYDESVGLLREVGSVLLLAPPLAALGVLLFAAGEDEQAEATLAEALTVYGNGRWPSNAVQMLLQLGWLLRRRGNVARAYTCFGDALSLSRAEGLTASTIGAIEGLATLAAESGKRGWATSLLRVTRHWREQYPSAPTPLLRPVQEAALAAIGAIKRETARESLRVEDPALTLAETIAEAARFAESNSLGEGVARALSTPVSTRTGTAASYPAGLSRREVEVLRLLAAGNSNREIAETLVLSVHTVENHLARIYAKIGATKRVDATVFALRTGLV
jgi:DNA-binding NarL/FixJ family response regulator